MGIFCATERRPFTRDGAGEEANTQKRRVGVKGARAQHLLQETGLQRRKGEQQKPQNETQTEQHNKHTRTLTQTRPHTQQKQTRTHTHTHKHAHRHRHTHTHTHTHRHSHRHAANATNTNTHTHTHAQTRTHKRKKQATKQAPHARNQPKHTNACDRCGPKAGDKSTGGTAECKTRANCDANYLAL